MVRPSDKSLVDAFKGVDLDLFDAGLQVLAKDYAEHLSKNPRDGTDWFDQLYEETYSAEQHLWSSESEFHLELDNAGLPSGFAKRAASNKPFMIRRLKDSSICHEWTRFPGQRFFSNFIKRRRDEIYGDDEIWSAAAGRLTENELESRLSQSLAPGDSFWSPLTSYLIEGTRRMLSSLFELISRLEGRNSNVWLPSDEPNLDDIHQVMTDPTEDPSLVGLYALSRIQDPQYTRYSSNHMSARNYARYNIAELGLAVEPTERRAEKLNRALLERKVNLATSDIEELLGRVVPFEISARPNAARSSLTLIVHGTWAATSEWWQPGGGFWKFIHEITGDAYDEPTDCFGWTGANRHQHRIDAAQRLMEWQKAHPSRRLRIIAHSHGGNICFLASRLGMKIDELITLGTPMRVEYLPDLRNIGLLHNVLSTRDYIQTPSGTVPNRRGEGRSLADGQTVLNYRAVDNGRSRQPSHSDLHTEETWTASGLCTLLDSRG